MRTRYVLLFAFLISVFTSSAQILIPKKDYVPEIRQSRYSFAICLISGGNSTSVSFGIMRQNPDSTREMIFLTKNSFLRQVSASERSRANPNKINFFKEYDIDATILDELWKLRFNKHPYGDELGWGTELGVPSKAQFDMLNEFGIYKLQDYAFANELWLFLQKVNSPVWVGQYQSRAGTK